MKVNRRFMASVHTSFLLSQSCAFVMGYIKSIFPPDFFKRTYISTQDRNIADMKRMMGGIDATEGEFAKAVPAIALHPTFTLDNTIRENPKFNDWMDDQLMNSGFGAYHGHNIYNINNGFGCTPIFYDHDKERFIKSIPKEIKLTFNIFIRCETIMQSWD